jgi:DNA-binding winged helix-turn-helix (wHTH) protein
VADERTQTVFDLAGFRLDVGRGSLSDPRGVTLALRPKSFDLLTHLFRNPGRIVSRDELLEAVWPGVFVSDDSLTQCVAEIRRVLGSDGAHLLRTVPKRGYILGTEIPASSNEVRHGNRDGSEEPKRPMLKNPGMERRLAAILAIDVVGYSRLVGLDETGTFRRIMALRSGMLEPLVAQHGGRIVSYAGDGALAEFSSVRDLPSLCAAQICRSLPGSNPTLNALALC